MSDEIIVLVIFYGGLSVFVLGALLYALWAWRHWKTRRCIED